MRYQSFPEVFRTATGSDPYPYQERIAEHGLPDVLQAPMGAGKSAAITLPWLWRAVLNPDDRIRRETPRRLVLALPMRTLVGQLESNVVTWLGSLGLTSDVTVHVVMGGRREDDNAWRRDMYRPSIVIGTVDCLVSKALMRGYGLTRSSYPIDFALTCNGSHFVIDEIQLAPASTSTMRQILGFAGDMGTAEPLGLTCMSATVDERVLDTVDNPYDPGSARIESIGAEDHSGELRRRLDAARVIRRLPVSPGDAKAIARAVDERHRPGTRTLVVLNTVSTAVDVTKALGRLDPAADVVLVHSRFRGLEREELTTRVTADVDQAGPGTIVVSTQVVEAGIDIDSATLVTESAPWPSLCQRTGRCNRFAHYSDAEVWWLPPKQPLPYDEQDIAESDRVLDGLEGRPYTSEDLLRQTVTPPDLRLSILRRPDFLTLFDTAPDLSGADIDVSPYVRDSGDPDVQVAWLDIPPQTSPEPDTVLPPQELRCPVSRRDLSAFVRRDDVRVWFFDPVLDRWDRVRSDSRLVPGRLVLASSDSGGYDPVLGFTPTSKRAVVVPDVVEPSMDATGVELEPLDAEVGSVHQQDWLDLDTHLRETRDQARVLVQNAEGGVEDHDLKAVVAASWLHDVGKAHPGWQAALRRTGEDAPEGALAKSPGGRGRLQVIDRPGFRHELGSTLTLLGPQGEALRQFTGVHEDQIDLVAFLIAAHHGKLRLQARDAPRENTAVPMVLGFVDGEEAEPVTVLGVDVPGHTVDLSRFAVGGDDSWSSSCARLIGRLGPFRLAYLETLVRIADWRSSARLPVPEAVNGHA